METETAQISESQQEQSVQLEISGQVAVLRLGTPDERYVTITPARMESFEQALAQLEGNTAVKGVVIIGSGPGLFCAGADINQISGVTEVSVAKSLASRGQSLFQRVAELKCTTVAAISGACVGGGYELALACDYRIASDTNEVRVGLPEINLGIIPGFGGSVRLPRLIGLPAALDIILKGRMLPAKRGLKAGLVDELIRSDGTSDKGYTALEARAKEIALGGPKPKQKSIALGEKLLTFTGIGRKMVAKEARKKAHKATGGHYPAPPRAIDVATRALGMNIKQALDIEAQALAELIITPESKSLVHVYFLTEEAGKRWKSMKDEVEGAKVAVLGAGTMGAGIAASLLGSGLDVLLVDLDDKARNRAAAHIEESLGKRFKYDAARAKSSFEHLKLDGSIDSITDAALVIEAIVEKLDVKKQVFGQLASLLPSSAILASNTSSLPISEIASDLSNPERVIGMHFFNPAEKMPLVEIVRSSQTDHRSIAFTAALASKLGKYPVVVEEVPGFLVNRILSPYLAEAAWALGDGYSIVDIDRAAVQFGMPMGPLRLLDEVGLDVAAHVAEIMSSSYGNRMETPPFTAKLASLGRLGRKSGKGFYVYEGKNGSPDPQLKDLLDLPDEPPETEPEELRDRLIMSMVNEAIRCFDEAVAGTPCRDAAGQIDLATIMGIGFAPFRGGIMRYAESVGARELLERTEKLHDRHGARFVPASGLKARAASGNASFYEPIEGSSTIQ